MSTDQQSPDSTMSTEDVDRIAERYRPAWEVDDETFVNETPVPTTTAPTTETTGIAGAALLEGTSAVANPSGLAVPGLVEGTPPSPSDAGSSEVTGALAMPPGATLARTSGVEALGAWPDAQDASAPTQRVPQARWPQADAGRQSPERAPHCEFDPSREAYAVAVPPTELVHPVEPGPALPAVVISDQHQAAHVPLEDSRDALRPSPPLPSATASDDGASPDRETAHTHRQPVDDCPQSSTSGAFAAPADVTATALATSPPVTSGPVSSLPQHSAVQIPPGRSTFDTIPGTGDVPPTVSGTAQTAHTAHTAHTAMRMRGHVARPFAATPEVDEVVLDFGIRRGRWRARHIIPFVITVGAVGIGLVLLLRQTPRKLDPAVIPLQAAPAHISPESAPGLSAPSAPAQPEAKGSSAQSPQRELPPPPSAESMGDQDKKAERWREHGSAVRSASESPSSSDSMRDRPIGTPAASAQPSSFSLPVSTGTPNSTKPREPAPVNSVRDGSSHRVPGAAPSQKPAPSPHKPAQPIKPGGIVREVPF